MVFVAVYTLWCAIRSSKCYNGDNNSDSSALQHISESPPSKNIHILPFLLVKNIIDLAIIILIQVFGFLTKPLIRYLLPSHTGPINNLDREPTITKEDMRIPLLSFEESASTNLTRAKDGLSRLMERPVYTIHSFWRRFDDAYMRPTFGGPRSDQPPS